MIIIMFNSSTCSQPTIALVATKEDNSEPRKEDIVTESRDFIKKAHKHYNSKVYLYSDIVRIPHIHNADQKENVEAPAMLKRFLASLGTHFNQKSSALVPLNWEGYSE